MSYRTKDQHAHDGAGESKTTQDGAIIVGIYRLCAIYTFEHCKQTVIASEREVNECTDKCLLHR